MKLQARFKTSSRKLKGVKTGEYNFWSVISLIVDAKLKESYELDEGIFSNMLSRVKGNLGKALKSVKAKMSGKASNIVKFFAQDPSIKINSNIKF